MARLTYTSSVEIGQREQPALAGGFFFMVRLSGRPTARTRQETAISLNELAPAFIKVMAVDIEQVAYCVRVALPERLA